MKNFTLKEVISYNDVFLISILVLLINLKIFMLTLVSLIKYPIDTWDLNESYFFDSIDVTNKLLVQKDALLSKIYNECTNLSKDLNFLTRLEVCLEIWHQPKNRVCVLRLHA